MGRPKKYYTEEEIKAAKRVQRYEYNKKYNEMLKNKRSEEKEMKKFLYNMYAEGRLYDDNGNKITTGAKD